MSAPGPVQRKKDGGRNDWQTPPELFRLLDNEFDFSIDGAASESNRLCGLYLDEPCHSAFDANLSGDRVFVNPPYGGLKKWIELFVRWKEQGNTVVSLIPAAPDTEWWALAYKHAAEVRLLSGRVKFINPETGKPDGSNTTGSTVFVFKETSKPRLVYLWDWKAEL
jgi:phage N-6-adenine-methyltransferase